MGFEGKHDENLVAYYVLVIKMLIVDKVFKEPYYQKYYCVIRYNSNVYQTCTCKNCQYPNYLWCK